MNLLQGDALELLEQLEEAPDLIVTDPPYSFGGDGDEHALSATVAVVLRESAKRLSSGSWMVVMSAASWRSTYFMVESVRGILTPVRIATWCKPTARTKAQTAGWRWASVNVLLFRKGKSAFAASDTALDHICAATVNNGRRAQVPEEVADWMVRPFATEGGLMLDPFAGSGVLLAAAERHGMRAVGFEQNP